MKKRYVSLAAVVAIAAIYFFYPKKIDKINQTELNEPEKITPEAVTTENETLVPPTAATADSLPAPTKDNIATEKPEAGAVTFLNPDGTARVRLDIKDKKISDAKAVIGRNEDLDVAAEFARLDIPDFRNENTRLLSGNFADTKAQVEFSVSTDKEKNMSGFSCFAAPGIETYGYDGLALKTDQDGYGVLLINENTYARIRAVYSSGRSIFGRLYRRSGDGRWRQVREFTAVETYGKLNQCYKNRYEELNQP